ncbi:MAG: sorbosone dehydrogenase family protein [Vicinamibacterales bacterium]
MRRAILASVIGGLALTTGAGAQADLSAVTYASGFAAPVAIVQDPTDPAVQFVVEQGGRIRALRAGSVQSADFLNLVGSVATGGERGLLGMAFAPDSATSRRFYVNFTNPSGHTVVARFRRSANPLIADPASRFDLRWNGAGNPAVIEQPFANHNGGHLAFGPDGYLYIGMGDGGSGDDPGHLAQSPSQLLGKMLRVDVNVADSDPLGYRVPPTNPFVSGAPILARGEIWAFGLRNPWRFSFDDPTRGGTGAMFIGDVGQNNWEEIDYQPAGRGGRNYGWRNREGAHDYVTSQPPAFTPLVDPIHEYSHSAGQSVTGGYVYRGSQLPGRYRGRYFFADFVRGRIWSFATAPASNGEVTAQGLEEHTAALSPQQALGTISSFGVDAAGELFLVCYTRGLVAKVVSALPSPPRNLRIIR